jgi:hypothetical protein
LAPRNDEILQQLTAHRQLGAGEVMPVEIEEVERHEDGLGRGSLAAAPAE